MFLTADAFAARVASVPDLVLSPLYWNAVLPSTTGYALWMLFICPALRAWRP